MLGFNLIWGIIPALDALDSKVRKTQYPAEYLTTIFTKIISKYMKTLDQGFSC
jgi:hypothetical protein